MTRKNHDGFFFFLLVVWGRDSDHNLRDATRVLFSKEWFSIKNLGSSLVIRV
jgi:hypothetical protein